MPSRIFPLKSTASIRRFEKRTSPLKRQFEIGSVEDDRGKAGFTTGKLFEKGSSLGLDRVEKQTSTCEYCLDFIPQYFLCISITPKES